MAGGIVTVQHEYQASRWSASPEYRLIIKVPCNPEECNWYDGGTIVHNLPCGGCNVCVKKHKEWSEFSELGDVVPLSARCVQSEEVLVKVQPQRRLEGKSPTVMVVATVCMVVTFVTWIGKGVANWSRNAGLDLVYCFRDVCMPVSTAAHCINKEVGHEPLEKIQMDIPVVSPHKHP